MLNTGYIAFISQSGGGFDANGNPIPTVDILSDYFVCSLKRITKELVTLVDGQYEKASYSIIIDNFEISSITDFTFKKVSIKDSDSTDLGTFQLHDKHFFSFTSKLKLIV